VGSGGGEFGVERGAGRIEFDRDAIDVAVDTEAAPSTRGPMRVGCPTQRPPRYSPRGSASQCGWNASLSCRPRAMSGALQAASAVRGARSCAPHAVKA
jgi:hypothetical protein